MGKRKRNKPPMPAPAVPSTPAALPAALMVVPDPKKRSGKAPALVTGTAIMVFIAVCIYIANSGRPKAAAEFIRFWWQCLWWSWSIAFGLVGFVQGASALAISILKCHQRFKDRKGMEELTLKIAMWAFFISFGVSILLAPYVQYRGLKVTDAQNLGNKQKEVESLSAQIKKTAPDIRLKILDVLVGTADFWYGNHVPIVVFTVDLRNFGAPSMVERWRLRTKNDAVDYSDAPVFIPSKSGITSENHKGTLDPSDQIFSKVTLPIQRGAYVRGIIAFGFPHFTIDQIDKPGTTFYLQCQDLKGKVVSCSQDLEPSPTDGWNQLWVYPGTRPIWNGTSLTPP